MGNVDRGSISLNKLEYITDSEEISETDLLIKGDLLFNTRNTLELVGKVCIWRDELPIAYYNSNLLKIDFDKSLVDSNYFMNYQFNSPLSIKQLFRIATGTTSVAAIYTKDLLKVKMLLPPLPEQKKIADILSTWDKAIDTTQALIEKLQLRKIGLMQQLLSGKQRLPGFSGEWEQVKLKECAQNESLRNKGKHGSDKLFGVNKKLGLIPMKEQVKGKNFDRCKIVKQEWFAYNPMRINIGSIVFHQLANEVMVSGDYVVFSCNENKLVPSYLNFYRKGHVWDQFMLNAGNGSVRIRIYFKDLGLLKISLPSIEEQTAIAQVLTKADEEINQTQHYLEQLQAQKKGLMQQLMTGQKRVEV